MVIERYRGFDARRAVVAGLFLAVATASPAAAERAPNVVVIFIDDMAYGDIGPFGADAELTPNLNRIARQGRKFTDFVVSSAVCSASRVALLTGCYHRRVSISGALGPRSEHGLHADEVTLAELCKQHGYATGIFGKWHLGHHPKFLPLQHGFDEYFGLPYSNDMWPLHPNFVDLPANSEKRKRGFPELPLVEQNKVVNARVTGGDQAMLTTWYTERAVDFIARHREQPFFLYVPHSMVHVPLFVSEKFRGKSGRGLFADVVMEIDWSVGQIVAAIEQHRLQQHTLLLFTSDNGPWLSYGDHAGSAQPLREGKGTTFEGGCREPTVMWWPGRIPAGTCCDELAATIDLLPTVAALLGATLPNHRIDGKDIRPLIFGEPGAQSPHEAFYYYSGGQLQAIRDREWKLHFPHQYRTLAGRRGGTDGMPVPYSQDRIGLTLFHLKSDVGEQRNVADEYPQVVARLQQAAEIARHDLGDTLTQQQGTGIREPGRLSPTDARLSW